MTLVESIPTDDLDEHHTIAIDDPDGELLHLGQEFAALHCRERVLETIMEAVEEALPKREQPKPSVVMGRWKDEENGGRGEFRACTPKEIYDLCEKYFCLNTDLYRRKLTELEELRKLAGSRATQERLSKIQNDLKQIWKDQDNLVELIGAKPAQTIVGSLVKLRVAQCVRSIRHGLPDDLDIMTDDAIDVLGWQVGPNDIGRINIGLPSAA